ncbi:MAG: TRAP transporter large permease subunit [Burkholderiaceae bacterium]
MSASNPGIPASDTVANYPKVSTPVYEVAGRQDMFSFMDHISRFTGLTVAQFYIVCAAVTMYEVIARYVFNAPTQWAFEVVMVLCATAWMLSAGYITLEKRHIGITVIYLAASERTRWWLDVFAMIIGVIALFLLVDDTAVRALESIDLVERMGSGFNSPQPMILKTVLVLGAFIYMLQLLVNLYRHFNSRLAQIGVLVVAAFILFRLALVVAAHYSGEESAAATLNQGISTFGYIFNPADYIDARDWGIGTASLGIVISLVFLMMTGMPLGIVTLIVSVLVALLFFGPRGLYLVSTNAFGLLEKYPLIAVPLFVLMASILERAGIAEDLFDAMAIFAGNLRGGVAVQTVVVAVILAAMSGVMGGEIVMLGLVALPQMLRLGYNKHLAVGVICASGSLATLIPPSIIMIVYGLSAEVSIGDLFMAGAVPGIMLATFYALYVLARCKLNPDLAPTAEEVQAITGKKSGLSRERLLAVIMCIVLIGCVMGSIYAGIASVTEAAGVGVFGAILVAATRMKFNWSLLQHALAGTMATVGTIIWLILGAVAFVGIYNLIGGADFMKSLFTGLGLPPMGIIFVMMGILIVLGTFMEWIAIVFITVPVFAPVVVDMAPELGLDPEWAAVWFGVLFVMNIQIYFLSPPFGPACFWLKSVAPPEITLQDIFRAVLPFIGLQIIGLTLVMIYPQIALWLPQWMGSS